MTVFTDNGKRAGSFIMSEANFNRSRENVVLASGNNIVAGAVLAKLTSGGKYVPYDNGGSGGAAVAVGIAIYDTDASAADTPIAVIVRDAVVNGYQLDFGSESGADLIAGVADLKAAGIIIRERPEIDGGTIADAETA